MTVQMDRLLRRREVEHLTGLSRTSIYRLMDAGHFPRPRRISRGAVAWPSSDIAEWMASRPENDRANTPSPSAAQKNEAAPVPA